MLFKDTMTHTEWRQNLNSGTKHSEVFDYVSGQMWSDRGEKVAEKMRSTKISRSLQTRPCDTSVLKLV